MMDVRPRRAFRFSLVTPSAWTASLDQISYRVQGPGARSLVGVLLKLIAPRRTSFSTTLSDHGLGAVLFYPGLLLSLPAPVVTLLAAGGVFYTVGITFHLARVRFQEAIWHGFVLAAAACHYVAVVYPRRHVPGVRSVVRPFVR